VRALRLFGTAVILAAGLQLTSSAAAGDCPEPTLTVSPTSGPPGTTVTFSGAYWLARCDQTDYYPVDGVHFDLLQAQGAGQIVVRGNAAPDERGSWSGSLVVSAGFLPGKPASANALTDSGMHKGVAFTVTSNASASNASSPSASSAVSGGSAPVPSTGSADDVAQNATEGANATSAAGTGPNAGQSSQVATQVLHRGTSAGKIAAGAVGACLLVALGGAAFAFGRRRRTT